MEREQSILVVEDDADLAAIMGRFLESEGFAATVARNAEGAFDILARRSFSLIVVDINLPGADGIELCRTLRRRSSIPVVFASAHVGDDARALALESGGDAYLAKPFSLRELLAQAKAVLKRAERPHPRTACRGLMLDAGSHRVCKNGMPVDLSPKEYALAAALMEHPGQALSRDQLLAQVWGAFAEVEPQTLAVHMRWLRSKLEDDPAHPTAFLTVRGFGYRFDPGDEAAEGDV